MSDDEQYTMGTTATPSTAGADAIDDADTPNGAATGVTNPLGLGGQADAPGLPFDRKPDSADPVHSPQIATENGEGGS
ncbi:hypothetical protein OHA72_34380 [Dactylosporangium sp. NBC_01737]|uniref:hypothetical protein n=1 Tax=Dactylosporangium sp. NBC_01737 TaxID=2975959 RepID=UPI002E11C5D9|nr:hypothetical protein OHA72_34380 [Dactylosporangium sp. NBC_01737]